MEIHFYEDIDRCPDGVMLHCDWVGTQQAIHEKKQYIDTTQMGLLSTTLLHLGYRVFIHPQCGDSYEITFKHEGADPDRSVRPSQNMFRMWTGGMFNK